MTDTTQKTPENSSHMPPRAVPTGATASQDVRDRLGQMARAIGHERAARMCRTLPTTLSTILAGGVVGADTIRRAAVALRAFDAEQEAADLAVMARAAERHAEARLKTAYALPVIVTADAPDEAGVAPRHPGLFDVGVECNCLVFRPAGHLLRDDRARCPMCLGAIRRVA